MKIKVYYFTGKNGDYKESKRIFNSFVSLYNNLNTFKDINYIAICDDNWHAIECINGRYNVIDYVSYMVKKGIKKIN